MKGIRMTQGPDINERKRKINRKDEKKKWKNKLQERKLEIFGCLKVIRIKWQRFFKVIIRVSSAIHSDTEIDFSTPWDATQSRIEATTKKTTTKHNTIWV